VLPLRPFPTTVQAAGLRRPVRLLLAASLALAVVAVVVAPALAAVALGAAVTALALVSGVALANRWAAADPAAVRAPVTTLAPSAPAADELPADALADELRALRDSYVERTNQAVAEGREDLVQELCDEYADRALALITVSV
jgi:hypothetical protein